MFFFEKSAKKRGDIETWIRGVRGKAIFEPPVNEPAFYDCGNMRDFELFRVIGEKFTI